MVANLLELPFSLLSPSLSSFLFFFHLNLYLSIHPSICHICCLSSIYRASISHLFCHLSKLTRINYLLGYSDKSSSIWSCQLSVSWSERNTPPHTHLPSPPPTKRPPLFLDNTLSLGLKDSTLSRFPLALPSPPAAAFLSIPFLFCPPNASLLI